MEELNSAAFRDAKYKVVLLHEGPQGLGENAMPAFAHPQRIEERDDGGALVGLRYEYPASENILLRDVQPLLEEAGADLVYNGHSHLWNRFVSENGVNYLEAANTGNSYGAFHPLSGESRRDPTGTMEGRKLRGARQSRRPRSGRAEYRGAPQQRRPELPFIADNNFVVFQALHTGTGTVTSWYVDMGNVQAGVVKFDEFSL